MRFAKIVLLFLLTLFALGLLSGCAPWLWPGHGPHVPARLARLSMMSGR